MDNRADSNVIMIIFVFFLLLAVTIGYVGYGEKSDDPMSQFKESMEKNAYQERVEDEINRTKDEQNWGPFQFIYDTYNDVEDEFYEWKGSVDAATGAMGASFSFMFKILAFDYQELQDLQFIGVIISLLAWFGITLLIVSILRGVNVIG